MDYTRIYNKIITNALTANRVKRRGTYFEMHHIIPRCIGGTNDKSNTVLLTAKEHYIAHKLLCKIYPDHPKITYAFWMMCSMVNNAGHTRFKPSTRSYAEAKELMATAARKKQLGIGRRPCMINNVYYSGIREASKQLSVSEHTLYNRLKSKDPSYYFVDRGPKKTESYKGRVHAKKLIIENIEYSSIYAAAKALNTSIAALRYRLKVEGKFDKFAGYTACNV